MEQRRKRRLPPRLCTQGARAFASWPDAQLKSPGPSSASAKAPNTFQLRKQQNLVRLTCSSLRLEVTTSMLLENGGCASAKATTCYTKKGSQLQLRGVQPTRRCSNLQLSSSAPGGDFQPNSFLSKRLLMTAAAAFALCRHRYAGRRAWLSHVPFRQQFRTKDEMSCRS